MNGFTRCIYCDRIMPDEELTSYKVSPWTGKPMYRICRDPDACMARWEAVVEDRRMAKISVPAEQPGNDLQPPERSDGTKNMPGTGL